MRGFFLFLLCAGGLCAVAPTAAKPAESARELETLSSEGILSVVIKAPVLNLTVRHVSADSYSLKVSGPVKWQKTEKGVLEIASSGFDSKKAFQPPLQSVEVILSGPSVPVRVFASSGRVSFSSWRESVFASLFEGEIKGSKNKGDWRVSLKEGDLSLEGHEGSVSAKGFLNRWRIRNCRGSFRFVFNEGLLSVKKSQGDLHFTTDKAKISLTGWEGGLTGWSGSGPVSAVWKPSEADLTTEEGPIHVSFTAVAPKVSAYTEKGRIFGAAYIPTVFSGTSSKKTGRIRGKQKKGRVSLRSETGNIYIK